jgi:tRNA G18 (ribose-2'-O)-methylase SpoU
VLEVIENLKKEAVTTLAIEQVESAIFLQNFEVEKNKKYALVFGNEVHGVLKKLLHCVTDASRSTVRH